MIQRGRFAFMRARNLMTQYTASMSTGVKIVTAVALIVTAGMLLGGVYQQSAALLSIGGLLTALCFICYLLAPVAYEVAGGRLTVSLRLGSRHYGPVVNCTSLASDSAAGRLRWTVRVFGNGGLFAGTGIYWNRWLGFFRAYVTSARRADLVLVETPTHKIVISPQDPQSFIAAA